MCTFNRDPLKIMRGYDLSTRSLVSLASRQDILGSCQIWVWLHLLKIHDIFEPPPQLSSVCSIADTVQWTAEGVKITLHQCLSTKRSGPKITTNKTYTVYIVIKTLLSIVPQTKCSLIVPTIQ